MSTLPTVQEVTFSVVYSRGYPSWLADPLGALATRQGYTAAVAGAADPASAWAWPWAVTSPQHWSFFWAAYLGGPERLRRLSVDAAWDRVVPLSWTGAPAASGPAGTAVTLEARLHPAAVTVVATVTATGSWPVSGLAQAVADLRRARGYGFAATAAPANRSLDGLVADVRDGAAGSLVPGRPLGDGVDGTPASIAAVLAGTGAPTDFTLDAPGVAECVAGLAGLGPPGPMVPANLVAQNAKTSRPARIYGIGDGHVIWRPDAITSRPAKDPVGCLRQNHTDGVELIEGSRGLVGWGAAMVRRNQAIDVRVQPVLERTLRSLSGLASGTGSYRSEVLGHRVATMATDMQVIRTAMGWPDG